MQSPPPDKPQDLLFSDATAPDGSSTASEESPWADHPFVVTTVRPLPAVSKLDPMPAAAAPPSQLGRSFVKRPPHPLLKKKAGFAPLPIASLAARIRSAAPLGAGKAPH